MTKPKSSLAHATWRLDDETWAATTPSFDNPDFVEIVLHSYKHRFGGIPDDPKYDGFEEILAAQPGIAVPCIMLQGRDDGVDPPAVEDFDRKHYTGSTSTGS